MRGFEETENNFRTDSPTCLKESLRIVLTIAASKCWTVNPIDIKAAFLQGKSIDRKVFLKPPKEAGANGKLWLLKKAVYGLTDASCVWYLRVVDELNKINAKVSLYDKALFFWHNNGELHGILVVHVDDFLWSGSNDFVSHVIELLKKMFKISREHESAIQYIGLNVKQENQAIIVDQMNYIQSIQPINIDQKWLKHKDLQANEFEKHQLRALLGQLNWVAAMSRPEISFLVSEISGVQSKSKVSDLLKANKILREIKNDSLKIKFVKFDLSNVKLAVYYDASFANLKDGGSQGGFIILLYDGLQNCCPIA